MVQNTRIFVEEVGLKLMSTIISPMQVHDISKVPAKRAREIGLHNEAILNWDSIRRQSRDSAPAAPSRRRQFARPYGNLTKEQQKWLRTRTSDRTPNGQSKRV